MNDIKKPYYNFTRNKALRPCEASRLLDGFQCVGNREYDIPSFGLVVSYILGPDPREVKKHLESPITLVYGVDELSVGAEWLKWSLLSLCMYGIGLLQLLVGQVSSSLQLPFGHLIHIAESWQQLVSDSKLFLFKTFSIAVKVWEARIRRHWILSAPAKHSKSWKHANWTFWRYQLNILWENCAYVIVLLHVLYILET